MLKEAEIAISMDGKGAWRDNVFVERLWRTAIMCLSGHPAAGRRFEDFETVREYLIQGMSFSLLYTVARDTVWIIDIRDQRGRRSASALRRFLRDARAPQDGSG